MFKRAFENNLLVCAFCNRPVDDPDEIKTVSGNTFNDGKCKCGSVYVADSSGHNL